MQSQTLYEYISHTSQGHALSIEYGLIDGEDVQEMTCTKNDFVQFVGEVYGEEYSGFDRLYDDNKTHPDFQKWMDRFVNDWVQHEA